VAYSRCVPLILLLMVHSVRRYWDDEGFREIVTSLTFGEVQDKLRLIDIASGNT
jgi:hypothetical protein